LKVGGVVTSGTERAEPVDVVDLEGMLEDVLGEFAFLAPCEASRVLGSHGLEVGGAGGAPAGVVAAVGGARALLLSGFAVALAWAAAYDELWAEGVG